MTTRVSEEELRKLKEENNVESLRQELEKERSRCSELEQKINDILRSRWASFDCAVIFVSDHLCDLTLPTPVAHLTALKTLPLRDPKFRPHLNHLQPAVKVRSRN